jgi:hypothetical protein
MPNHRTFEIDPVRKLIDSERIFGLTIEPFPFQSKTDCFDYLAKFADNSADFGLIDPPYSNRQRSEHYNELGIEINGWHTGAGWTKKLKDEVARVMKVGGKTITFGWNSSGMGKDRGFELYRILLVAHGGDHNDTICTVERKVQSGLSFILSDVKK